VCCDVGGLTSKIFCKASFVVPKEETPFEDTLYPPEPIRTMPTRNSPDEGILDSRAIVGEDLKEICPNMGKSPEESLSESGEPTTSIQVVFDQAELPTLIGRYCVKKFLGKGGFGLVYLAYDEPLNRFVAIKVPRLKLLSHSEIAEAYLSEARTVANLDHPHIVPVYDVGSTPSCPCYIVSKYIDGTDLASRIRHSRLSIPESISLVATVADALHHAHTQHIVHRDVKPGNILLDHNGRPFVADFGLALREQENNDGPYYVGTPSYMSPEQVRGEGHRVDGRSDIFSLGVVLYELVVGRRPYIATSAVDVLKQISHYDPRPPRQCDESISRELDRICL